MKNQHSQSRPLETGFVNAENQYEGIISESELVS